MVKRPARSGRQEGCLSGATVFVFGGLSLLGWQAYSAYGRTAALATGLIGLAVCLLVALLWVFQFFAGPPVAYCTRCGGCDVEPVSEDATAEQYRPSIEGESDIVECFRCKPCNRLFWRRR